MSRMAIGTAALIALLALALAGCGGGGGGTDAQAVVGTQGGIVRAASGTAVDVPAGALSSPTSIQISALASAPEATGLSLRGDVYSFEPDGLRFDSPATLRLPYSGGAPGEVVRIATYDPSAQEWTEVAGSVARDGSVTVPVVHFSIYAPMARDEGDPAGGRIAGNVTSDDAAVVGATVTVASGPGDTAGMTATTGEAGGFELEGLPAGEYALTVTAPGYIDAHKNGIAVADGETTEVVIVLCPNGETSGAVAGLVRSAAAEPLAEARITIESGPTTNLSSRSSIAGQFRMSGLLPGVYALKATLEGYEPQTIENVEIVAGQTTQVDFSLVTGGSDPTKGALYGVVLDGDGNGIEGAAVVVEVCTRCAGQATTDENGAYRIEGLSPGDYTIQASKSGYASQSQDATVEGGQETELNFELAADDGDGALTGTVTDGEGNPVAGVEILVEPSNRCITSTRTGEDGTYRIDPLAAGNYLIVARKGGYVEQSQEVTVTAGPATELDFTLAADGDDGALTGTVTDGAGNPIAGVEILVEPSGRCITSTATGEDGAYLIDPLAAGDYLIVARKRGYVQQSQEVTVTAGAPTVLDFTLEDRDNDGSLVGYVRDGDGNPIAGAAVVVEPSSRCVAQTETDENGAYTIAPLGAGDYSVIASKDGYDSQTQEVTVTAGEPTQLDFVLGGGQPGRIYGYVNGGDLALVGAVVEVVSGPTDGETQAGYNGSYELADLMPGQYTLRASMDGYTPEEHTITLGSGDAQNRDFSLTPE